MTPQNGIDGKDKGQGRETGAVGGDRALDADMVGLRIRAFRECRGWTQADLSKYLGIKREQVSKWERGNHYPKRQEVARLYFDDGIDFNYIYGGVLRTLPFELRKELLDFLVAEFSDHPHILHKTEMHLFG